jgi:hypothetical protein
MAGAAGRNTSCAPRPTATTSQVNLQVFRDLVWPVRFPGVQLAGDQTLYLLEVEHDTECWATKVS